jgi:hypothetical protein
LAAQLLPPEAPIPVGPLIYTTPVGWFPNRKRTHNQPTHTPTVSATVHMPNRTHGILKQKRERNNAEYGERMHTHSFRCKRHHH